MGQGGSAIAHLLHELTESLKFLAPPPNELVGLETTELIQVPAERILDGLGGCLVIRVSPAERLWYDLVDDAKLVEIRRGDLERRRRG